MKCPNCNHEFTMPGCDSVSPLTGARCGQPLSHARNTRCGNGLEFWEYNPPKPAAENLPLPCASGIQEVSQ